MEVIASAPGKLFLIGEYAVGLGAPAVAVTLDRRVHVTLRSVPGTGSLRINGGAEPFTGRLEIGPSEIASLPGSVRFPAAAALVCAHAFDVRGLDLDIDASSPLDGSGGGKVGLGSSAAVVAATVAALSRLSGEDANDAIVQRSRLGVMAHRLAQGGGSGADVVASTHGGVVWCEGLDARKPGFRVNLCEMADFTAERLVLPPDVAVEIVATGRPAASAPRIARFMDVASGRGRLGEAGKRLAREWSEEMGAASVELREGCLSSDPPRVLGAIVRARRLLERLAPLAGIPILGAELRRACAVLPESLDVAIKPSGAGGGDCAIALLRPSLRDALRRAWREAGLEPLDVPLTEVGARVESCLMGTSA